MQLRPALITRHRTTQHPHAQLVESRVVINWRAVSMLAATSALSLAAGIGLATSVLASVHADARAALVAEAGGTVSPDAIAAALDTPCATEDSDNCYWLATTSGNGAGAPFVTVDGHTFPLPR